MSTAVASSKRALSVFTTQRPARAWRTMTGTTCALDEGGDLLEQRRGGVLVGVEAAHQLLPRVQGQLGGERDAVDDVEGRLSELERALVLELGVDAPLDVGERRVGVDEVIVEVPAQAGQGVVGQLLERPVAVPGERLVDVGGAQLHEARPRRSSAPSRCGRESRGRGSAAAPPRSARPRTAR